MPQQGKIVMLWRTHNKAMDSQRQESIDVIVPVYNEEKIIVSRNDRG